MVSVACRPWTVCGWRTSRVAETNGPTTRSFLAAKTSLFFSAIRQDRQIAFLCFSPPKDRLSKLPSQRRKRPLLILWSCCIVSEFWSHVCQKQPSFSFALHRCITPTFSWRSWTRSLSSSLYFRVLARRFVVVSRKEPYFGHFAYYLSITSHFHYCVVSLRSGTLQHVDVTSFQGNYAVVFWVLRGWWY